MLGDMSKPHRIERRTLLGQIGQRIRWVRQAYEDCEPGKHSQAQWARALGITPETYNRIELGRFMASPEVLIRIIHFSGISADYVLFGVLDDLVILDWLNRALHREHGAHLLSRAKYQRLRLKDLQIVSLRPVLTKP